MKSRVKSHDPHEEESRDLMRSKEETSEGLSERVKLLEDRLNKEVGKNADLAKKVCFIRTKINFVIIEV